MAKSHELEQVGQNIRKLRKEQGLTQQTLAEKAGLSLDFVGGIERGVQSPSIASLGRVARALRVPLVELFAGARAAEDEFDQLLDEVVGVLKGHARTEDLRFILECARSALRVYGGG